MSGGTIASITNIFLEPGFARRGGVITQERAGLRQRSFDLGGTGRPGLSVGGSEHFGLPQVYPMLRDVDVFLGGFGSTSRPLSLISRSGGAVLSLPPVKKVSRLVAQRLFRGSSGGPDEQARARYRTLVVAETFNAAGQSLARAVVEGPNPYDFTGEMLAWAADRIVNVGVRDQGALGPVTAFGLDELTEGARQSGLERTL